MWKTISIPWCDDQVTFRLPQTSIAWVVSPKSSPAVPDEEAEIMRALHSPIGSRSLEDLCKNAKGKRTTILVDDGTRVTPVEKILPLLLDELNRAGVKDHQIKVIIALGTHRFMSTDEIKTRLGESAGRVEAINHAYNDPPQLINLGKTNQGTPIIVNRWYYESDISIGVSNIIPHFIAGWSGGAKIVQPGVSGEETTAQTHINGSMIWPTILGNVENPIRHEMEDVARRSGLKMIVNTILNPEEKIVKVVAGDFVAAHREGVRISKEIYQFKIKERPDIVIAGSYPANKDLWQADKALAAAVLMVKPGGIVIWAAPCVEGISPEHPLLLELGATPAQEVYDRVLQGEFDDPVAAATIIKIGVMREMAKVTLVSQGVNEEETKKMGFGFAKDIESAIDEALTVCGASARIGVLTHGADSAPLIE